jgi:hypothetical protein
MKPEDIKIGWKLYGETVKDVQIDPDDSDYVIVITERTSRRYYRYTDTKDPVTKFGS